MAGRKTEEELSKHHKARGNARHNPRKTSTSDKIEEANREAPARPTAYTQDMGAAICDRMRSGETLVGVCADETFPTVDRVYLWRKTVPEFARDFATARVDQMHAWADQMISLADDSSVDYLTNEDGTRVLTPSGKAVMVRDMPQRIKLKIEARQWLMERIAREEYGLRQTFDVNFGLQNKDDAEIVSELRRAVQDAGMTKDEVVALIFGEGEE